MGLKHNASSGGFGIVIQTCVACGGAVRIVACIEDPEVIEKILAHLDQKTSQRGMRVPWYHSAARNSTTRA